MPFLQAIADFSQYLLGPLGFSTIPFISDILIAILNFLCPLDSVGC